MIETQVDAAMRNLKPVYEWEKAGCPILPATVILTTGGVLVLSAVGETGKGFWRGVGGFLEKDKNASVWRVVDAKAAGIACQYPQYVVVEEMGVVQPESCFFGVIEAKFVTKFAELNWKAA